MHHDLVGMKMLASFLAPALALTGCAAPDAAPTERPHYLYYLHGKIIEDLGPAGVSPRFGRYDYPGIIQAFERARTHCEKRGAAQGN